MSRLPTVNTKGGAPVDQAGYEWFSYKPGPLDILSDIGNVLWNDILGLPWEAQ